MRWTAGVRDRNNARTNVLIRLAWSDPDRVFDLLFGQAAEQPTDGQVMEQQVARFQLMSVASASLALHPERIGRYAARLPGSSASQRDTALPVLVSTWVQRDTEAAMTWLLSNRNQLDDGIFNVVASRFASSTVGIRVAGD